MQITWSLAPDLPEPDSLFALSWCAPRPALSQKEFLSIARTLLKQMLRRRPLSSEWRRIGRGELSKRAKLPLLPKLALSDGWYKCGFCVCLVFHHHDKNGE